MSGMQVVQRSILGKQRKRLDRRKLTKITNQDERDATKGLRAALDCSEPNIYPRQSLLGKHGHFVTKDVVNVRQLVLKLT